MMQNIPWNKQPQDLLAIQAVKVRDDGFHIACRQQVFVLGSENSFKEFETLWFIDNPVDSNAFKVNSKCSKVFVICIFTQ